MHYAILVFGEDVDAKLEPFEYEPEDKKYHGRENE